jgi:molybdopterin molybdotransferase
MIISSAGVSVGAFDYIKSLIEDYGGLEFWRVNMRPGKPFTFGHYQNIPYIGLPGNPVSSFVGFEVFLRPAIRYLGGEENWQRPSVKVELLQPVESDGRESYFRAHLTYEGDIIKASLTGHQGSGNLYSLVLANGLIIIPAGTISLPSGSIVDAWFL